MSALITLLSDFGSSGPYPAAMKAVIASCCDPLFIDISHEIPRHNIRAGAYLLFTVAPFTPAGTIHLAVVDPGVGTPRRALILSSGGQFFVGPDNGLLVPAAR
ncbi:MAG TPA: SAM-dependent chlorinase/fluorinase, partial [bacterium]|nr:SAM-dependent chlorinase/fluorinase [bacterium]